jgi:transcriptional regulator with XRE-family HTH domain
MIALTATETLGGRIRRLRKARGWSQETLAIQADTDQAAISDWERDTTHPLPPTLHKIAAAFGLSIEEFLT